MRESSACFSNWLAFHLKKSFSVTTKIKKKNQHSGIKSRVSFTCLESLFTWNISFPKNADKWDITTFTTFQFSANIFFLPVCLISLKKTFLVEVVVKQIIIVMPLGKMSHYFCMCPHASNSFHECHLQNKYYKSNIVKWYSAHPRLISPTL